MVGMSSILRPVSSGLGAEDRISYLSNLVITGGTFGITASSFLINWSSLAENSKFSSFSSLPKFLISQKII